jgi:hypothetical protein
MIVDLKKKGRDKKTRKRIGPGKGFGGSILSGLWF